MAKEKRSTFLKNPLDSLAMHAGKLLDRMSLDDLISVGVGLWGGLWTNNPLGFATGLLGYRLARTEGGMPPVSQMAGLAMLAFTGIIPVLPAFGDAIEDTKSFLGAKVDPECVNPETGKINLDCVLAKAFMQRWQPPLGLPSE
jgi:hypothetical protein